MWDLGSLRAPQSSWVLGKSSRSCVSRRETVRKSYDGFGKKKKNFCCFSYLYLGRHVHVGMYTLVWVTVEARDVKSPQVGVTHSCDVSDMTGPGN